MKNLEIKYLKIEDIKPYDKNPRNNEDAIDYVANSIKEFGFKNPIILDKNNIVVCGHTRLEASKKLKLKEVPCIYADDLTEEQIKAFRLADNKVAEIAEWDFDLLNSELEELASFDFNMEDFGFENGFDYNEDDFDTDFELPDGDKSPLEQITFTLHEEQAKLIREAIKSVKGVTEDYLGNTNKNGNAIWEVVRQWEELKK